ncbi:MAG TPA: rhomboid family intramembrane serine protease [Anaerolineaceae bacterium]|nr:rhomboid family intramembrane serine protease [Anaerolineaceae bacterium]
MIPIRDNQRTRTFPIVNWILIIINILAFSLEYFLPTDQSNWFVGTFALIPARVSLSHPLSLLPFLTHMFLHGSWYHLISNMWFLMIFGDNIEDRLGSKRYLFFYVLGGISAGLLQYLFAPTLAVPTLGASGAIAAVMGAYFVLFPTSRVVTFIPIFFFGGFVRLPAIVYLGIWFVMQIFSGFNSFVIGSGTAAGGVAWWAHVGGFLFGMLFVRSFQKKTPAYYVDEGERYTRY